MAYRAMAENPYPVRPDHRRDQDGTRLLRSPNTGGVFTPGDVLHQRPVISAGDQQGPIS